MCKENYETPMAKEYDLMRKDENNMSYWFPKLEGNVTEIGEVTADEKV